MSVADWISSTRELEQLVEELVGAERYALDTEFHRERTYLPVLGLVQISTPDRTVLVDPLSVDVGPLARAFEGDATCVMHAASQDLEILELACGSVPRRLFDTQIAALFCGYRTSSLTKLLESFLGLGLDKSSQLSDWTRRPLPDADLAYAAADVAHLLDLHTALRADLGTRGRIAWAEEEIERLRRKDRSPPEPETLWWRLRGKTKLGGRARGVAQELAIWREEEARRRDRPPRSVLSDMALLAISQRPPKKAADLQRIRNLDPGRLRDVGSLLEAVDRGLQLPKQAIRLPPKKPADLPSVDGVIALCLAWLSQRAADEELDVTVLATRDEVSQRVLGAPSRLSSGWREALVGHELASIIDGTAALRVVGTRLELVDRNPS